MGKTKSSRGAWEAFYVLRSTFYVEPALQVVADSKRRTYNVERSYCRRFFIARSISRFWSRSFSVSRLSMVFLPRASPRLTLTLPERK